MYSDTAAFRQPHYGYFAKQATIFSSNTSKTSATASESPFPNTSEEVPVVPGFTIASYPNMTAFQEDVAEKYDQTYGELVPESSGSVAGDVRGGKGGLGRQVWHTPTELFRVSSCYLLMVLSFSGPTPES